MRFSLSIMALVRLHGASLALVIALVVAGCGRTGLDIDEGLPPVASAEAGEDAGGEAAPPEAAPVEDVVDSAPPPATTAPPDPCASMPPIPCSGGGYEYCVAGHYSECPKRCAVCVPGSTRVCFITYCKSWGVQTCASDGLSFGFCQETSPPAQCAGIGNPDQPSPALEQCCIDSGNCCQDLFDLNGNGDTGEQIGNCSGTTC